MTKPRNEPPVCRSRPMSPNIGSAAIAAITRSPTRASPVCRVSHYLRRPAHPCHLKRVRRSRNRPSLLLPAGRPRRPGRKPLTNADRHRAAAIPLPKSFGFRTAGKTRSRPRAARRKSGVNQAPAANSGTNAHDSTPIPLSRVATPAVKRKIPPPRSGSSFTNVPARGKKGANDQAVSKASYQDDGTPSQAGDGRGIRHADRDSSNGDALTRPAGARVAQPAARAARAAGALSRAARTRDAAHHPRPRDRHGTPPTRSQAARRGGANDSNRGRRAGRSSGSEI